MANIRRFFVVMVMMALAITALASTRAVRAQPQTLALIPASPNAFESVTVRITDPQTCAIDPKSVRIRQVNSQIEIVYDARRDGCVMVGGPVTYDIGVGRFPPGTYQVKATYINGAFPHSASFLVADSYAAKQGPFPLVDYTDHWWNAQEPGWGLSIHQHTSDRLFAVWFVYGQTGQPTWYTLQPGEWTFSTLYKGPIYKTTGPYFGGPFDPNQVGVVQVGSGKLVFNDSNSGTFSYTVEGISGSKPITRLPF